MSFNLSIINNYWTRLNKMSWFVSGEQINYLLNPKAEVNNWIRLPCSFWPRLLKVVDNLMASNDFSTNVIHLPVKRRVVLFNAIHYIRNLLLVNRHLPLLCNTNFLGGKLSFSWLTGISFQNWFSNGCFRFGDNFYCHESNSPLLCCWQLNFCSLRLLRVTRN